MQQKFKKNQKKFSIYKIEPKNKKIQKYIDNYF